MAGIAIGDRLRIGAIIAGHQVRSMLAAAFSNPLARWRFSGGAPERLTVAPQDLRTADPTQAADYYAGHYVLGGAIVDVGGESPFSVPERSVRWQRELHGFSWLRHLRAADTELTRLHARALIGDWIDELSRHDPVAWAPDVAARRLISWFSHSPLILRGADEVFYRRFMRSLTRQVRYLIRATDEAPDGVPRFTAVIALCYAGLCVSGRQRLLRQASRRLDDELGRQILPDGGHISRNPEAIIDLLLDLLPLRQTFAARDAAPSRALISAIDRMMPMLRFFRHDDGTLAHFNGMGPTYPDILATLLAYDEARGSPVLNASHSGYQRIEAGETIVIVDTGAPPPALVSQEAHAGCLSLEMSSSGERIIVNCGVPAIDDPGWRMVSRSTAAHSTATLDDTSSCRFATGAVVTRRLGPVMLSGPHKVGVERRDEDVILMGAGHDGYRNDFGVLHERRLAVKRDGLRIDGEDVFTFVAGAKAGSNPAYAIRFHLHPLIRASHTPDGGRVLLSPVHGDPWEFYAGGADVSIEESVYLGGLDGPRRSDQVVLHGRCRHAPRVNWRLRKLPREEKSSGVAVEADEMESEPAEGGYSIVSEV